VDRAGWDQQLIPDLRVVSLPGDLELHLTFEHGDQLVRSSRRTMTVNLTG
jgi:hypothetical protein